MAKGKAQNKERAGNQFSKESFGKLSQDLQISVLLRLLGHSLTEPKSLDIFKLLCPKPEEYFTEEVLSSKQFGSNTVKQNICDIFKIHFYSVTGSNEGNLINSLKYLFSDHKLNIKNLILDNYISFDRIIIYLTATKGKKKLLEYLLEHKTNGEFTFKDLLIQKDVVYPNSDIKYSLYDIFIFSDLFSSKLKQYFGKSKIQQENIETQEKKTILEHYQINIDKFLNENKKIISIDKKASELIYLLFSGNTQNIDKFLNELNKIDVETVKSNKISHVIDVFKNGFFFNCDISEQVKYLKVCAKSYQEYGDSTARLKIYNDIKTLIDYKIIDAKDCNLREQMADFLYSQTSKGFQDIFYTLLDKAATIDEGEVILIKILINNANSPIIKVMAYNLLNNKLFDSQEFKLDLINSCTEGAISLIENHPKVFNVGKEDIINDMRMAYWFRGVYYNKSGKNTEAMQFYLKFLELINKKNIGGCFEEIKVIISIALNNPELSTEIDKIFTILSKKQGNEKPDQKKLFKEIVTSHITEDNAKGYLAQINKFQSANEVKSIALEVCEKLAKQLLDSAKDQAGLSVKILFKESYLHLPYEAGTKYFSKTKDGGDLVQAVMFFLKYNRPQQAEEYLAKIKKQGADSTLHGLDDLFGELHLNTALSFIQQDITINKSVIKKHLDAAKKLNPSLDIDIYYTLIEIWNKSINDDLKEKIQQNKELQNLVDEEIQEQNSYNDSNQHVNLPITSSTDVEPATNQNDLYQRAIHRYYTQKKRQLDNSLNLYSSWKINDKVYSTKDSKIVDLGYNKYCVIDESKYFPQYKICQKAMEKGYVSRAHGQNGVKLLAGKLHEIKIKSDNRLHNDLKTYVNPEGKTLIIFVEEAGHARIKQICNKDVSIINVDSADVVLEEAIQGTVDQDNNILEQLLEYPPQGNGVDLGGDLYNVESDKMY
ncbi:MAG: hypothetical protein LN563_06135 [Rickettsia endosymbiont of Platyusa sonomae]|nr:hypothetical protein [Rickettsia endosymbiont of Platyusa sonomae]